MRSYLGELRLAAIPPMEVMEQLRNEVCLPPQADDVYLAYSNGCGARFAGFLVCKAGCIDRLLAFCPVPADLEVASGLWQREVGRQRRLAINVATGAIASGTSAEVIWLNRSEREEVPLWLFALACVPLTSVWDGKVMHPRPFCPSLFESMAEQPEAQRWLMQRTKQ
jgi:hypothetical protein